MNPSSRRYDDPRGNAIPLPPFLPMLTVRASPVRVRPRDGTSGRRRVVADAVSRPAEASPYRSRLGPVRSGERRGNPKRLSPPPAPRKPHVSTAKAPRTPSKLNSTRASPFLASLAPARSQTLSWRFQPYAVPGHSNRLDGYTRRAVDFRVTRDGRFTLDFAGDVRFGCSVRAPVPV